MEDEDWRQRFKDHVSLLLLGNKISFLCILGIISLYPKYYYCCLCWSAILQKTTVEKMETRHFPFREFQSLQKTAFRVIGDFLWLFKVQHLIKFILLIKGKYYFQGNNENKIRTIHWCINVIPAIVVIMFTTMHRTVFHNQSCHQIFGVTHNLYRKNYWMCYLKSHQSTSTLCSP